MSCVVVKNKFIKKQEGGLIFGMLDKMGLIDSKGNQSKPIVDTGRKSVCNIETNYNNKSDGPHENYAKKLV